MTQIPKTFLLRGGLNIVTPAIAVPNGMAIAALNYECDVRGYRRCGGYERYNGRPRPSQAPYWYLEFDQGTAAIVTGNTVTGLTSGATGTALQDGVVESGSYGGGDADGYLVLGSVVGTFVDGEQLRVGGVTKCFADDIAEEDGAPTAELDKAFTKLATDARRALIAAVPGSGPVRMTAVLNGVLFAIRDNAGATAGVMHKATAGGWSAQNLGSYLKFDGGTSEPFEGDAINGQTSGATAVIERVVLLSGNWSGTAAGYLVLSSIVGTFQNNENIRVVTTVKAVADGVVTANALPPGGKYDWCVHNFYGPGFTDRLYAAGGVGRAFEWDGNGVFALCYTGLSDALDKPIRLRPFAKHLILGFDSGYYVNSEIGTPTQFQTTLGAGDGTTGSTFTDIIAASSTSMIFLCEKKIGYLTGTDVDTFVLDFITEESGASAWTGQVVGEPFFMDDAGVRKLSTTQAFGNWRMGTITQLVEPIFRLKQDQGVVPACSIRVRAKDQYKVFFDDRSVLSIYLGRKDPECMLLEVEHDFFCSGAGKLTGETNESLFVGGEDGFVYELERGRSFDGEPITAFLRLFWDSVDSPSYYKVFHRVALQCDVAPVASLSISCDFDYGNPDFTPSVEEFTLAAGGGFWDEAIWDEFFWDTQVIGLANAYASGYGRNMSAVILSEDVDDEDPHTLSAMTVNFSQRGLDR